MFWKRVLYFCIVLCLVQSKAKKLYKSLGLSHEDFKYIINAHKDLKNQLKHYSEQDSLSSDGNQLLFQAAFKFKKRLAYIEEKYLSDVNNIIFGNNNLVVGDENVVYGQCIQIYGDGNFVFHDKFNDVPIIGGNIVRIGKYDVDLDLIYKIKNNNPSECITILN